VLEFLFLLLPVAALSGWWIGRREKRGKPSYPEISPDYLRGISYLLNDQQDKALDVFMKMVESNSEIVEIHLALGNLFRRQGEVERSIRIHQNLIARPNLNRQQRAQALYELSQDYMKAGLLDRAEKLFLEILDQKEFSEPALRHLLMIYQQEKDWRKAIQITERLDYMSDQDYRSMQSQFYCELAEHDINTNDLKSARQRLQKALYIDKNNVRASILEGNISMREGRYKLALKSYKRIENQDADYMSEVVEEIADCYAKLGKESEFLPYLKELINQSPNLLSSDALLKYLQNTEHGEVLKYAVDHLKREPDLEGVLHLFEILGSDEELLKTYTPALLEGLNSVIAKQPRYKCNNCGFKGMALHWSCPSCHQWGTNKSILVALDFPDVQQAMNLVSKLEPSRCRLKVGKELFTRGGPQFIESVQQLGFDIFLDLKFHDIPNTVAAACRAASDLGVWMINVHALGGRKMLTAARGAVEASSQSPKLIAVTILTSMSDDDLHEVGLSGSSEENVSRLAGLARDCGLDGVVCSAQEARRLRRENGEDFQLVTPGIRPSWSMTGDQSRVMTPQDAIEAGSDYLVIGRPITMADDPLLALQRVEEELKIGYK
jgi:orotidine 5'-phosphate decarboxylase subfamily 1